MNIITDNTKKYEVTFTTNTGKYKTNSTKNGKPELFVPATAVANHAGHVTLAVHGKAASDFVTAANGIDLRGRKAIVVGVINKDFLNTTNIQLVTEPAAKAVYEPNVAAVVDTATGEILDEDDDDMPF